MTKLRAYTTKECRDRFQKHMFMLCKYWSEVPQNRESLTLTERDRMEGLCHSIQAYLDGRTLNSPSMDLVIHNCKGDKEFHISEGENWFEDGMIINDESLTETFFGNRPK